MAPTPEVAGTGVLEEEDEEELEAEVTATVATAVLLLALESAGTAAVNTAVAVRVPAASALTRKIKRRLLLKDPRVQVMTVEEVALQRSSTEETNVTALVKVTVTVAASQCANVVVEEFSTVDR